MFNPNIIIKTASELNLLVDKNSPLFKILAKIKNNEAKDDKNKLVISESDTQLLKTTQQELNELKKIKLKLKILNSGLNISNMEDVYALKKLKIDDIIDIDPQTTNKIHDVMDVIHMKENNFKILKAKDDDTLLKDYNLMPKTNLILFIMFLIMIGSVLVIYLSYSYLFLFKKFSFLNENTSFWCLLLGFLTFITSLNFFIKNVFIKLNQIKNIDKIKNDLVKYFLKKRQKAHNKIIKKLKIKQFQIEKKSLRLASREKIKQVLIEEKNLLKKLETNFNQNY